MTLQQLEYVVALNKHRNFEKAAESCYVTQPTLSMLIKKLELEIGFEIFNRTKKPVEITALGELFLEKAISIVSESNSLKVLINHDMENSEGEFRIGIIPTLAPYLLPIFLPGFIALNPKTFLNINELQSEEIISQLKTGKLDIGILSTPLEEKNINEEVIFYEPFFGYFPKNHPQLNNVFINIQNLNLADLLVLNEGHCFRNQTLKICDVKDNFSNSHFKYQSGSIETIKRLIEKNMGFSLIPALATFGDIDQNLIRKFKTPVPAREISVVSYRSFFKNGLIRAIKNEILKNIPIDFITNEANQMIKWR